MENDQRRILFAFLLIVVILLLWSFMAKPKARDQIAEKPETSDETAQTALKHEEVLHDLTDTIVIDRNSCRIVFTALGAGIKSFYIKEYNVDLVPEGSALFLTTISDSVNKFNYDLYEDSLVFFIERGNSRFIKTYHFDGKCGFNLSINNPESFEHALSLRSGLRVTEKKNQADDLRHFNVYVMTTKLHNITKEIKDHYVYKEAVKWLALRNKYFVLIVNNSAKIDSSEFFKLSKYSDAEVPDRAFLGCMGGGNTHRFGVILYSNSHLNVTVLGLPIIHSELAKYRQGYEQIASSGLWDPIARIILIVLHFFYGILKNYGFAIIMFALLFKLIFFPLSRQMLISQQKMQMLQPELKKVQEQYKNDPQALNREMMHLYKVYKVNPFSGCLPLLIQFPIFIALYQVLSTSFEFRGAPFILWITDLSVKDPYYILPVSMGVLMLVQSLMTTVDPRQRFMVIMMPLVMIFVFLNFPSGLQLYWFTYNILSIFEQLLIKKKILR